MIEWAIGKRRVSGLEDLRHERCRPGRVDRQQRQLRSSLLRIDVERFTITVLDGSGCDIPGGGVVVSTIVPPSARVGSTLPVTIAGSGFAPEMGVSFEGGSGPPPTAGNVVVSADGTTIQATVTVKKGKPGKDPVWDVRVGSGLLPSGFTVVP
jgi:hypothetical protein